VAPCHVWQCCRETVSKDATDSLLANADGTNSAQGTVSFTDELKAVGRRGVEAAEKSEAGVCVKVRVRIEQELTYVRPCSGWIVPSCSCVSRTAV